MRRGVNHSWCRDVVSHGNGGLDGGMDGGGGWIHLILSQKWLVA